jgi:hypothetical protein
MLISLLFFFIVLAFSVFYFIKKQTMLSIIGFALWFLFVVYEFNLSTGLGDIYSGFAAIGGLMAFMSLILPLTWRPKLPGEEEESPVDYYDDIAAQKKQIRDTIRKMRGED